MIYNIPEIAEVAEVLKRRLAEPGYNAEILKSKELKDLYSRISSLPNEQKANFGKELNGLKNELASVVSSKTDQAQSLQPIDLTAPYDVNIQTTKRPRLLNSELGSSHPLMRELDKVHDIFYRMGFNVFESRQIDDDFHMFASLNFPAGHPARDHYDTFMTTEGLIAPAHVSTMQNRVLNWLKPNLEKGQAISAVYTGRSFRNEDVDVRHEHTFYQVEIMYVDKDINVGNLIATFRTFLGSYYEQDIEVRMQPFYFPFTEPSFEMAMSCPFCKKKGCNVCSFSGWIELLGMGMVHPNVLKTAGIDPSKFTGFAGGLGLERLVMMKYDIEDVRYFESGRLEFLRQFK